MNPMAGLVRSRKFWLAVLDAGVSTISVVAAVFLSPEQVDKVLLLVGIWQPVFVAVIAGIAYEDGKEKQIGRHPSQLG
jgi:hypothetical protein